MGAGRLFRLVLRFAPHSRPAICPAVGEGGGGEVHGKPEPSSLHVFKWRAFQGYGDMMETVLQPGSSMAPARLQPASRASRLAASLAPGLRPRDARH